MLVLYNASSFTLRNEMFVFSKIFFLLMICGMGSSFASGFQLFEGNAINISDFGAGGAANLKDASATFFNPAALTELECSQLVIAGTAVFKTSKFTGDTRIETISRSTGTAVTTPRDIASNASVNSKGNNIIPAMFYGAPINKDFAIGFGLSVPFGLSTQWAPDSAARYSATKTRIKTLNFGPSVAYKINEYFILGGGLDVQYLNAEIHSAVATPTASATLLGVNADDNFSKSSATGIGAGGNFGILLKPMNTLNISLHYRSRIDHHVSGTSEFKGVLARNGPIINDSSTSVTLPDTISFNSSYAFTDKVKFLSGIYYTTWSTLKGITLKNIASPGGPVTEQLKLNFRNTWRFVIGAQVDLNSKIILRTGVGYDQGTTKDADRTLRAPDNDRLGLSIGGRYKLNKMFIFDFGYTHIFVREAKVNHKLETNSQNSYAEGKVRTSVNLLALQITSNFC